MTAHLYHKEKNTLLQSRTIKMSDTAIIIKRKIQETIARADTYPLLEIITNRLQRGIGTRLRSVFSRPVEVMLDSKEILRFGDYFDTLMFPAVLCIFESDRLPGRGLSGGSTRLNVGNAKTPGCCGWYADCRMDLAN